VNDKTETIIFPNPFDDKLNIVLNGREQSEIILYDILSRKLLRQAFINSTMLNVEWLASGLYMYEVRNNTGIVVNGKVVKQ
jgi:hypothetical protein